MNTELIRQEFKENGFPHVYEWIDEASIEYPEHIHKGRVSFYVIEGDILMNIDGAHIMVRKGEKIEVPPGIPHSAKTGLKGCSYIVGEEIEGDS